MGEGAGQRYAGRVTLRGIKSASNGAGGARPIARIKLERL